MNRRQKVARGAAAQLTRLNVLQAHQQAMRNVQPDELDLAKLKGHTQAVMQMAAAVQRRQAAKLRQMGVTNLDVAMGRKPFNPEKHLRRARR